MDRNVTIDPLARATAVAAPEISEIRRLKSGQILDVQRYIERSKRRGVTEVVQAHSVAPMCRRVAQIFA